MKKRLILTTLIIGTLVAVPLLHAGPFQRHHRAFGGHDGLAFLGRLEHLKNELDLSPAQVDQLEAIVRDARAQNAQYRDQMRGAFKDVASTLLANPNDIAAAQVILDRQADAEKALKANVLVAASKALNVLTPDQRAKLADHLAENMARRENRWGRGR